MYVDIYTLQGISTAILIYYLAFSIVTMLTVERLAGVFLEERKTSRLSLIGSYFLYLILQILQDFYAIFAISSLLSYFIIALNYKSSMLKRVVAAVCSYLCIQLIQGLFFLITGIYTGGEVHLDDETVMFFVLISGLFGYIIASLLRKFKNIKKSKMSLPASWISLVIIPIFSVIITVFQFLYISFLPQFVVISVCGIAFAIIPITFYLQDSIAKTYDDKLKSALHEQEKEYYFTQCQLMKESAENVKSMRHDMKLHLTTVSGFIASDKANKASEYLAGLLGDLHESEVYSDTGNIAFDSIVNFKLKNAIDDNIKVTVNMLVPSAINIEAADVVTILGNLLDNALEAVSKIDDTDEKIIKLDIESHKNNIIIKLDNTFDGEIKYTQTEGGNADVIVTRKGTGNHGHGLKNVRKSVEKYDGHMDISHDANIFSVGILLYV